MQQCKCYCYKNPSSGNIVLVFNLFDKCLLVTTTTCKESDLVQQFAKKTSSHTTICKKVFLHIHLEKVWYGKTTWFAAPSMKVSTWATLGDSVFVPSATIPDVRQCACTKKSSDPNALLIVDFSCLEFVFLNFEFWICYLHIMHFSAKHNCAGCEALQM